MARSISVFTCKASQEDAFEDFCAQIDAENTTPKLIIFTSDSELFWYFSTNLKIKYENTIVMGGTTAFNYNNRGYNKKGASALVIFSGIECSCGQLFQIQKHPMNFSAHIHNALDELSSKENTCCIEFCTGFSNGEELVLDTFERAFTGYDIPVIGSSAAVDGESVKTFVSLNGEVYKNTCVFCLIHNLEGKIFCYRENIYTPTNYRFIATDVSCEDRIVYELDDKPTAKILSERLNVPKEKLSEFLMTHPMGRIENGDVFITECGEILPDDSIVFYSRLYNRTRLALLEVADIRKVWSETEQQIKNAIPEPSFAFVVNCISRSRYFEKNNLFEAFNKQLQKYSNVYAGISGYGEQLNNNHLNQSMIIVVFE